MNAGKENKYADSRVTNNWCITFAYVTDIYKIEYQHWKITGISFDFTRLKYYGLRHLWP